MTFIVLDKAVQEFHVLAIAYVFPDHLLVQTGVFSEPLCHLFVVQRVTKQAFLLKELNSFLWLLVELLCTCDKKLNTTQFLFKFWMECKKI